MKTKAPIKYKKTQQNIKTKTPIKYKNKNTNKILKQRRQNVHKT